MTNETDLLEIGRRELRKLHEGAGDPDALALALRRAVEDPDERYSVVAALYAAVLDGAGTAHAHDSGRAATAALGAAAGLSGHTSDLYRAARVSADVRAVERTAATGDPRYVERRLKNKLIGRALGRSGAWRKLWK